MYIGRERTVVRRAELADLSRVERVARATWPVAYAGIIPDEVQRRLLDTWYSPERLSQDLVAPGSTFLVAELSGDLVGFAQYVRRSAESVELTRIYVLPGGQRSGIGAGLLGTALAEFADEGLKRLTVVASKKISSAGVSTRRWASPSREAWSTRSTDICSSSSNTVAPFRPPTDGRGKATRVVPPNRTRSSGRRPVGGYSGGAVVSSRCSSRAQAPLNATQRPSFAVSTDRVPCGSQPVTGSALRVSGFLYAGSRTCHRAQWRNHWWPLPTDRG